MFEDSLVPQSDNSDISLDSQQPLTSGDTTMSDSNDDCLVQVTEDQESVLPQQCDHPQSEALSSIAVPSGLVAQPPSARVSLGSLEDIRVPQDFVADAAVEDGIGQISYRRPKKNEFFRVRAGDDWQATVAVIADPVDKQLDWLILPHLVRPIDEEFALAHLRLAINRFGTLFVWGLKMSRDGRSNTWNDSAMQAAQQATTHWVRLVSSMESSQYLIKKSLGDIPEPVWPDIDFLEAVNRAFSGRIVNDINHPFLQRLRGEI